MTGQRRAAAAAIFALVALGLPTGMLGVAWPSIRETLGAPLAGLGVLVAAMTAMQFAASTFSGAIRDRLGTTRLLVVPTLCAAAGLATFALASDWLVITTAAALIGAGVGLLDAAVNTEAALRRGVRFMGALHGAWAIGAAIGPAVITFAITDLGSWRYGYVAAALAFVLVAVSALTMRTQLAEGAQHDLPRVTSVGAHLATGAALMFVYVGIELGAGQWAYTRYTANAELDTATAATAVFLFWAALGAGRVVLAAIGDRLAPQRWLDLSVAGAVGTTVAISVAPPNVAALIALPLLGLSLSGVVPVLIYLTPHRVGHVAAPRAIGYMVAAGMLGGVVPPAVIGVVMQVGGVALLGPSLVALSVGLAIVHGFAGRRGAPNAVTA
ncbi:MAG TPA: MFS transporter [Candidatus Limnocylindrales bacterium]|nr:MFS transporter [Candidatus Limnocylindrales bacterium]